MGKAVRLASNADDLRRAFEILGEHHDILPEGWSLEHLIDQIRSGAVACFVENRQTPRFCAVVIRTGNVLQVVLAAGVGMLSCLHDAIADFAQALPGEAERMQVRVYGRNGWWRFCKEYGLTERARIWQGSLADVMEACNGRRRRQHHTDG